MSVSMKENQLFEAIRNHQTEAPASVMEKAIQASKKRRFLTFHWTSLNVWYLAFLFAGSIGWGLMNKSKHSSFESNVASEKQMIAPSTESEMKVAPLSLQKADAEVSNQIAVVSQKEVKPELSEASSVNPSAKEAVSDRSAQEVQGELQKDVVSPVIPNMVTEEKVMDANVTEVKENVQEKPVEVKAPNATQPNAKKKKLAVKVVRPQ
jgi:hypothetical protein